MGKDFLIRFRSHVKGYNLRWFQNGLNLSGDEKVRTARFLLVFDATKINNNQTVVVPDPNLQTNNGGHYDLYIEGHNITQEVLNSIDTQTGVSGLQLNLYTANDVNEGTVRVLNRRIKTDAAKYETGTQYVEFNKEWTANATLYQRNDRIVYGYNIYRVANHLVIILLVQFHLHMVQVQLTLLAVLHSLSLREEFPTHSLFLLLN